jgi:hypothetical protein
MWTILETNRRARQRQRQRTSLSRHRRRRRQSKCPPLALCSAQTHRTHRRRLIRPCPTRQTNRNMPMSPSTYRQLTHRPENRVSFQVQFFLSVPWPDY